MTWGQRITIKLYGNTIQLHTYTPAVAFLLRCSKISAKEKIEDQKGKKSLYNTSKELCRGSKHSKKERQWEGKPQLTVFLGKPFSILVVFIIFNTNIVDLILELICLIQYHLHHLEGGKKSILKCHGICDLIFLVFYSCTHSASSEQEEASLLFLLSSFFCKFPHVPDKGRVDRGKKRNAIENEGLICRANSCEKESVSRLLVFERLTQLFLLA